MEITNPKVAGLEPRWAPFRGFSLLFENPGDCLTPAGNLLRLACRVEADPELRLYRALAEGIRQTGCDRRYSFCPLPHHSYHVTVWDGCNDGNLPEVCGAARPAFRSYVEALPGSLGNEAPFTGTIAASPLVARPDWGIRFRFSELVKWGDSVLVVRLAPADGESERALSELAADRKRLTARFREAYGIGPGDEYRPHVSLGYFANAALARGADPHVPEWEDSLSVALEDVTVTFPRIALYGFTDMASFFRLPA